MKLVRYEIEATYLVSENSHWYAMGEVTDIPCHTGGYYARYTRKIYVRHNKIPKKNWISFAKWLASEYAKAIIVGPFIVKDVRVRIVE